jgi:hypothetical protein
LGLVWPHALNVSALKLATGDTVAFTLSLIGSEQ